MTEKDKNNKNLEMLDNFLSMSKDLKDPSEMLKRSKSFFDSLMGDVENMMHNKDYDKLEDTFKTISTKLQNELHSISEKYGISVEEMQKLVNDPSNFKKEDWEKLQNFKQGMETDEEKKASKVNNIKNKMNWTPV